jgi:preprotein translocase subunit SecG
MSGIIIFLIVLVSVVLAFFILVQSPKGGGLTGNFGSSATQAMGVKQSSDVMEKGTWASMGLVALLCILLVSFGDKAAPVKKATKQSQQQSQQQAPAQNGGQQAPAGK